MTGRTRGSSNDRGRGRGRARSLRRESTDDILKKLDSLKLVRVSSVGNNSQEPSLDDVPSPVIRDSVLKSLSESNLELEVTLRKCHKLRRYDLVPLTKLVNILQNTEKEIPELLSKFQDEVICSSSKGPKNFYLQWSLQAKRLYLLGKWMHDMCDRNKSELIKNAVKTQKIGIQTLVGRYVSVPYTQYEPLRARGMITEVLSELTANVYLIDYGEEKSFLMTDIRVLPMELNQEDVKPFCFPARLANVQSNSNNNRIQLDDRKVEEYFQNIVNNSMYRFYCTVESLMPAIGVDGPFTFVSLSIKKKMMGPHGDISTEEEERDVAQLIQERMNELEQELMEEESRLKTVDMSQPTHAERRLLLFNDQLVNVRDHSDIMNRGLLSYRIIKIINPGNFYCTLRLSPTLEKKKTAWERDMQAFYQDEKQSYDWRIRTNRVFRNRCYVWLDAETSQWNRVRVLLANHSKDEQVLVWLVDSAVERVVRMSDMMELNPTFSSWHASAFKAHLVDIEPFSKTGSTVQWSKQSISLFEELCPKAKLFHGVVIERINYDERKTKPSRGDYFSFGMIFSDIRSESPSTNLLYTVQAQLVRRKVVRGCGPGAGYYNMAYLDGSIPNYNRRLLEQEFTPYLLSNNSPHPPLPPSQPVSDESSIHRGTSRRGGRRMRAPSPLAAGSQHQINTRTKPDNLISILQGKTDAEKAREQALMLQGNRDDFDIEQRVCRPSGDPNVVSIFHRETKLLQDLGNFLPLQMRKNLGWIVVNSHTVQGLSCFYIQMMSKFEEMCQMMDDLEKIVRPAPPLQIIEPGMLIAAQIVDEKSVPYWARVLVKSFISSIGLVKGILIDYGQEVSAKVTVTRALPPYFSSIPSYCQRVHLDLFSSSSCKEYDDLKPAHGKGWPETVDTVFKRILVSEKYSPFNCVYLAWISSLEKNVGVEIEAFNQPLVFDAELETWVPGKVKKHPELDEINRQKDENPLVRQFFKSIPLNIMIEEESQEDNDMVDMYKFIPLWKLLRSNL